ncbi:MULTISPECIES: DUF2848 family protein [unclassified Microbacterium]|uniref:DUF2848 family protein n=1 Tax=unclassified Microbacterium TaxID=2609290 RepID=UPI0025D19243|nr:DUF2848 family protein [uncultured Microbacterium sp.]
MSLVLEVIQGGTITLSGFRAVVAGYTGRDAAAVQHHIDELAAIGIPAPPVVPMFYPMPTEVVTTATVLATSTDALTSGEVEPVYIRHRGAFYLGVGSDHTDRDLERSDIPASKRACPKPIGPTVLRIDDFEALDLDGALAVSTVDDVPYQRGKLDALRRPADVVGLLLDRLGLEGEDFVCFGGTIPLLDGRFSSGRAWGIEIALGAGKRLTHHYSMEGTGR